MTTFTLSENIAEKFNFVPGKNIEDKIANLLENNILYQLKECEDYIFKFETKYGMDFDTFSQDWENDKIFEKYNHETERDFMEWEGFILERKKLLNVIKSIRENQRK
jgi:hypothetical protein